CSKFIDSPFARTGILDGNPIHADMVAAARMAKLRYCVNVIIDENKRTVAAFAGGPIDAHAAGCAFLRPYCEVSAKPSDIVITTNGGAPLDQNIYQCVKAMTAAEAAAKEGGVIILCAACADGAGGESFYRSLKDCESASALYESIMETPQQSTIPDQWESQILARILKKHRVVMVTRPVLADTVRDMKMEYAASLQEALKRAYAITGEGASLTVIPNGVSVIVS
ncbi:MAG: lactate racemization operon protein LarA, partial [Eubacteriales bacterium]|nr:lactate racemization operon protein LarA [Eubacteriales bacterium]